MLQLGPFRPDMADTIPGTLRDLLNASLKPEGEQVAYGPVKGFRNFLVSSASVPGAGAKGVLTCVTAGGAYLLFVMSGSSIFQVTADGTWLTIGTGYALPQGDRWGACQFGKYAIFTNTFDGMLKYDIELGGAVSAISGAPRARIVRTVFDSLFALDCDGDNKMIRYSSINEPFNWTSGTSNYQPVADGEELVGIEEVMDGTALVFQRNAIRTLYRSDTTLMFNMRKPVSNKGAVNPWCIVPVNGGAYFIDSNGFGFATSEGIAPIGRGKVNQWWLSDLDTDGLSSVQGAYDAEREVIRWRYRANGDGDTSFTGGIDFDITTGEFVPIDLTTVLVDDNGLPVDAAAVAAIFTTASTGVTMEDLDDFGDMDNIEPELSLDDRYWLGGIPLLGAIVEDSSGDFYLAHLIGDNLTATFETSTLSANESSRITSVRPVTDAEDIEVQVGRSDRLQDALTYNTAAGLQASGRVSLIAPTRGKNHTLKATIPASDWTYFRGYDDLDPKLGGPK